MTRLYGHIPDGPEARDYPFDRETYTAMPLRYATASVEYYDHLDKVPEQLGNSCVGHALASSCYLRGQVLSQPIARPSALMIYTLARLADRPRQGLFDFGCRPRFAIDQLKKRGMVPERSWAEHPDIIDVVPQADLFDRAEGAIVQAYYRIADDGDVAEDLRQALRRGMLPIFGMEVDQAYEDLASNDLYEPAGDVLGRHAQVVVGYNATLDAFHVLNSWGSGWGSEGFAWIPSSFMATRTVDRLVVETIPKEV